MARNKRYKLRNSDRSGFEYKEIELVNDKGSLVGADEFDTPPPSNIPLGGEGDISGDPRPNSSTSYATPSGLGFTVQYVTAGGGISFQSGYDKDGEPDSNLSWILVSGSNQSVDITKDPQISRASQNSVLTIECVGSGILLQDGSGLSLRSSTFLMDSGAILSLFYSQTDNLWHEESRSHRTKNYGEF